jgi:undecaprenyl-diphosphatase
VQLANDVPPPNGRVAASVSPHEVGQATVDLLRVLILAVVQGLTEFLPVSSDGHLVVTAALFEHFTQRRLDELLELEIVLHAGTLGAVLVYFRRPLLRLLSVDRRVIGLLVVGTLPAVVIGLGLKKFAKPLLEDPLAAGIGLVVTGLVLLWAKRFAPTSDAEAKDYPAMTYAESLIVGFFQAVAVLPGVSRSGLTISSELAIVKLRRAAAADFSFLLSVPAVGGAVLLQVLEFARSDSGPTLPVADLLLGVAVSFVVGLAALRWLLAWLQAGRLYLFAWWCIPLGLAVTAWQLAK